MVPDSIVSIINDPRNGKSQRYSLFELVLIVFSSVISGYDTPDQMREFASIKIDWLRKFAPYKFGTPCTETLRYLLCAINPSELVQCFQLFVSQIDKEQSKPDTISLDGKTMRGTGKTTEDALHMISAWSHNHGITLAALESKGKKNEIETLPQVVSMLGVENAIVTTDSMGCQKKVCASIIDSNNDYLLQIKDNQKCLLEEIKAYFHKIQREKFDGSHYQEFETVDKGHGRLEVRRYTHFELTDWIDKKSDWKSLCSAIMVERTREIQGVSNTETSWYISSLAVNAEIASRSIRAHWGVENNLHWWLDVIFKDDNCGLHSAAGPLNLSVIKRFCMNLLRKDTSIKTMKNRVMACAIDDSFRERVLRDLEKIIHPKL